jgi:ABC-type lipoprotein export system ATPase subunit
VTAVRGSDLFHLYRAAHGDVAALRGLSLTVADGEVVAVLGPSGSGKTTLLGLCAGFLRPSSGDLHVLGHAVSRERRGTLAQLRRRSIGIVRQHYHLSVPRELTVEQIVELPLQLAGRRDPRRVTRLLAAAGLARRARSRPAELSGGELQRVAVCAALAKAPRLVLADEPTGELDAVAGSTVIDLMLELARDAGSAALVVTHDAEIARRSDRTIHIRDGRLAAEGTTRPVLIVDDQGWLRLPHSVRERAGVRERVHARASWGRIELLAHEPVAVRPAATAELGAGDRQGATAAFVGVTRRYDARERPVLDALSWTFAPGRLHVVAGPSGSGKTTVLNLLAALDRPDGGEVIVDGTRVDALAPDGAARWRRASTGFVSQHSTLAGFLTAVENVELALALREVDGAGAQAWLERCGVGGLADRRADRLSGGEQRRVALARALAAQPSLLLADEPTAHLDRVTGRAIIELLRAAARDGTTVVAATHDPDLVAAADERLEL